MPIFEYQCSQCNKTFEKIVFSGDKEKIECPECKSDDVKKKVSATSFMGNSIGTCASGPSKGFS